MARENSKEDSVYDFFYIDARRIALFNSQLSQYGHLTSLTRSVSESNTAAGGINVVAAKLDTGASTQTGQIRQFDAQWMGPLTFLDEAARRGMIIRGLENVRIGQVVLAAGSLEIRDLMIIKQALALPSMKSQLTSQVNTGEPRRQNKDRRRHHSPKGEKSDSPMEFALDFIRTLPHALHATVKTDQAEIWCSLREDSLLVEKDDLFLKHGIHIDGVWNILGILDVLPGESDQVTPEKAQEELKQAQEAIPQNEFDWLITLVTKGFGGFIDGIAPLIKMLLGRPTRAFGMTPLLIFREVGG